MKLKYNKKITSKYFFKYTGLFLLIIISLLFLYPILWLFDASFRPMFEIFQVPPTIFQKNIIDALSTYSLDSYYKAIVNWELLTSFFNSALVTLSGILLTILVCSLGAYAFSYFNFPGKNIFFILILSTMMLPMTTLIVPFYKVLQKLYLINNLLGLIIPYSASAFCVFLLRQYFIKIPYAFIESAKIDGLNNLQILHKIILPLSKPALAALAIIQFRLIWNDFLYPMIILRSEKLFTLTIKLQLLDGQHFNKPYDAIIATGFIAAIIPIVFFLFFQRHFIEGLTGGLKN